MSGGIDKGDWLTEPHGVFRRGCEGVVVVGRVDLGVNPISPVVVAYVGIFGIFVALDKEFSPNMQGGRVGGVVLAIFVGADTNGGDTLPLVIGWRTGTGLVVVVDDVHIHGFTAITAVASEIVDDIVAIVHPLVKLCGGAGTKARGT